MREPTDGGATLGSLYVDDVWQCWTLEDPIRERPGVPVFAWKVQDDTAIPAGSYRVVVTPSPKFHRRLPLLEAVPGFTGIRVHGGNVAADTRGCVLVGRTRARARVGESQVALAALLERLDAADGPITIDVENPPGWAAA